MRAVIARSAARSIALSGALCLAGDGRGSWAARAREAANALSIQARALGSPVETPANFSSSLTVSSSDRLAGICITYCSRRVRWQVTAHPPAARGIARYFCSGLRTVPAAGHEDSLLFHLGRLSRSQFRYMLVSAEQGRGVPAFWRKSRCIFKNCRDGDGRVPKHSAWLVK